MMAQAAYTVFFYLFACMAVVLALAVVFTRKLLRAAVALMAVLTVSAGLYLMLGAEFLAGVQVMVYVGGIVVLIVFAIMLTRSADLLEDQPSFWRILAGGATAFLFVYLTMSAFLSTPFAVAPAQPAQDSTIAIGRQLLNYGPNGYVLPFEIISLLLLAAVLGGIVIARKIPAPGQPFTSGGDFPGEAEFTQPRSQREEDAGTERGAL